MPGKQLSSRKNKLYHFLSYDINICNGKVTSYTSDILKETSEGSRYAMLTLACDNLSLELAGCQYTICDHHISIYEDYQKFSHKSEYHYTAHLLSNEGHAFVLHVYFSAKDVSLALPSLKQQSAGGKKILLDEGEQEMVQRFARTLSQATLSQLRNAQARGIKDYVTAFEKNLEDVFNLPQTDVYELESCIQQATLISNDAQRLEDMGGARSKPLLVLYQMMIRNKLDQLQSDTTISSDVPDETFLEKSQTNVLSDKEQKPLSSASKSVAKGKLERESAINQSIEKLQKLKNEYNASLNETKTVIARIAKDYAMCAREAMLITFDAVNIDHNMLKLISQSVSSSEKICCGLLSRALLGDDFGVLEILADEARHLPDTQAGLLVSLGKERCLKWLLEHGDVPVNYIQVTLQKSNVPFSLLETAVMKEKVSCFRLLLEHGASPYVIASNGLPLAFNLLQNVEQQQFATVLLSFYFKKGTLRQFAKELALVLRSCEPEATIFQFETLEAYAHCSKQSIEKMGYLKDVFESETYVAKRKAHVALYERHDAALSELVQETQNRMRGNINIKFFWFNLIDRFSTNEDDGDLLTKLQTLTDAVEQLVELLQEMRRVDCLLRKSAKKAKKAAKQKINQIEASYMALMREFEHLMSGQEVHTVDKRDAAEQLLNSLESDGESADFLARIERIACAMTEEDLLMPGLNSRMQRFFKSNEKDLKQMLKKHLPETCSYGSI